MEETTSIRGLLVSDLGAEVKQELGGGFDSLTWAKLSTDPNIGDYNVVLLDLTTSPPDDDDRWMGFERVFAPQKVRDFLGVGSILVIYGDARRSFKQTFTSGDRVSKAPPTAVLEHLGFVVEWINEKGTNITKQVFPDMPETLPNYSSGVTRYKYAIRDLLPTINLYPEKCNEYDFGAFDFTFSNIKLIVSNLGDAVAAYYAVTKTIFKLGHVDRTIHNALYILPKARESAADDISMILRDFGFGTAQEAEPEWLQDARAPGEEPLRDELVTIEAKSVALRERQDDVRREVLERRWIFRLLYERGFALEATVREAFRRLGAEVEDPPEGVNKEDGWATYKDGQFVLEVKSTSKETFNLDGLRQLMDWVARGIEYRVVRYKGVFVGNTQMTKDPRDRAQPFVHDFIQSAKLYESVALRSEDLFRLVIACYERRFRQDAFWEAVRTHTGVLVVDEFISDQPI